ncbi:citrate synthase [Rhodohalobacter mucosus]|uniref:Citrate synthase n=1 Tax=Rhodohalobacter mucosus TaxID=2079485 RepID=A0A316TVK2_9BACT|nr:citrate synthase [Rhodohalobacter mucosus]PWN06504.1 citrate (Si)-synthase [Rhodohalobacter mucosus]
MSKSNIAKLEIDDQTFELDIIEGSEGERAIDITNLRSETGFITSDTGYKSTGATRSAITFLNGEKGILRYRGYPIEQLASQSDFLEVAYLLIYGDLPGKEELESFTHGITRHTLIHEDMKKLYEGYPEKAHPMGVLASMISALSTFYPDAHNTQLHPEQVNLTIRRLIAKSATIAAWSYRKSQGFPIMYPQNRLDYCANFLHMMFALPTEEYEINPTVVKALNTLLILHADHEQNCSTSTVRIAGSSHASLYAAISSGVCALWGPLHGGANQKVIEMLEHIRREGGDVKKMVEKAKDKDSDFRLMGFGHRVYKNFDPRAKIIKKVSDEVLNELGVDDPLLEIATSLEEVALNDSYFVDRKLYPNVDFYSGILYRAIGIPTEMFTVMFALGRLPGWIAQWKEMRDNNEPISRPRQIYVGPTERDYVPLEKR